MDQGSGVTWISVLYLLLVGLPIYLPSLLAAVACGLGFIGGVWWLTRYLSDRQKWHACDGGKHYR